MRGLSIFFVTLSLVALPFITAMNTTLAQEEATSLVASCEGSDCSFCHLLDLVNKIIKWIVVVMVGIIVIIFALGGMMMVISAGDTGKVSKGKGMMLDSVVGFLILLCSYVIVDTFIKVFVPTESEFGPWNTITC